MRHRHGRLREVHPIVRCTPRIIIPGIKIVRVLRRYRALRILFYCHGLAYDGWFNLARRGPTLTPDSTDPADPKESEQPE